MEPDIETMVRELYDRHKIREVVTSYCRGGDRMVKRGGEWRIAARKCVAEWGGIPTASKVAPEFMAMLRASGTVARDRSDSSYERPLTVAAERIGINLDILPPGYAPG